jgi:hypothetical protein
MITYDRLDYYVNLSIIRIFTKIIIEYPESRILQFNLSYKIVSIKLNDSQFICLILSISVMSGLKKIVVSFIIRKCFIMFV